MGGRLPCRRIRSPRRPGAELDALDGADVPGVDDDGPVPVKHYPRAQAVRVYRPTSHDLFAVGHPPASTGATAGAA